MLLESLSLLCLTSVALGEGCYWNEACPYKMYSTKTPYDSVRGDIRDQLTPPSCSAVSMWSLHRHGNRNPSESITADIKRFTSKLQDDVIASYNAGRSLLCAQDIEDFHKWTWNETIEASEKYLTGVGYKELYDIGRRLQKRFPALLNTTEDHLYFRSTNRQRTVVSALAFIHGLTEGTGHNLTLDGPWDQDEVIRERSKLMKRPRALKFAVKLMFTAMFLEKKISKPYEHCDRFQQELKKRPDVLTHLEDYDTSPEYLAIQASVQERLGTSYQLSAEDVYILYETCRFHRSWSPLLQSPWCAPFTQHDLEVLEYRDDVRHYYRNGYGSWVNERLGGPAVRDMYQHLQAAVQGEGMSIVSYFAHDTLMEMVYCAMGLYKDEAPLMGSKRRDDRMWKTSKITSFAANIIVVLNRCIESDAESHRVQVFVNEKPSTLCPAMGCNWAEFEQRFRSFANASLDFCSMDYPAPAQPNGATGLGAFTLCTVALGLFLR